MKITREQVEHIAHLARLEFSEKEIEAFTRQMDNILTYFDKLQEVDTTSVEPTSHAIKVKNIFRDDEVKKSIGSDLSLKNAPEKEGNCFRVPKIIE